MGRAERHAGDHKPTTLQVAVDAMRLHHHTCLIMRNPKYFNPEHDFNSMTLVNIFETTLEVYLRIYEANSIKAETPGLARERLALQSFAVVALERMQALQDLARGMFSKLRGDTSKFWYWCNMAEKLKTGLKAWHDSDAWTAPFTARTLDKQYKGAVGYNPGSQMVQIAGISYMNTIDHFVKERLRIRHYVHYMDDLQAIMPFSQAEAYLEAVRREAAKLGLTLHPEKTRITNVRDGAVFLGFLYRLTESGKVLMFRDPKRVKEIRRRMKRLASRERRGEVPQGALDESYRCVRACMEKGNSRRMLLSIDNLHDSLKGEIHHGRTA